MLDITTVAVMWKDYRCDQICSSLLRRWGNLPVDDALQFEHDDVVKILRDYQQVYSPGKEQHSGLKVSPQLDTIEVIA